MDFLRTFFYPGSSSPAGDAPTTLYFEGLDTGWAVIILIAVLALSWWLHQRWLPHVSIGKRLLLVTLRGLFVACLLFAATRPVLITTVVEDIRQRLIILVDSSESMTIADRRDKPEDIGRLAILSGEAAPGSAPAEAASATSENQVSRAEMLQRLANNNQIDLWEALADRAELVFYEFGRDAIESEVNLISTDSASSAERARAFFANYNPVQPATALGESLRQAIDRHRGEPLAGIVVISDGASNSGFAAPEAAAQAQAEGLPLYLYGIGVTEPQDVMITSIDAPEITFINERVVVRTKVRANGYEGEEIVLTLTSNDENVDELTITLEDGMDEEFELSFIPEETGNPVLRISTPELPGEASAANNQAETRIRIVDNRVKVFMIEQQPRWDYRYLLDFLQNDRRLTLTCVLLDGDPSLLTIPNSPFLLDLPDDREALYDSDIILIGDVDPARLGTERMEMIREWVDEVGGGLVILGGPKFQPRSYLGTPLEALLPVIPASLPEEEFSRIYPEPVRLVLTQTGTRSPLMRLADSPLENSRIWESFSGVRWTAPVARARPGAEILLVDPTPEKRTASGPLPVMARQNFGRGEVIYFGFNETYRWRSQVGGEYYSRIWAQILQALALDRLIGASKLVQLRSDRSEYLLGEQVTISGQLYQPDFRPLAADIVPGFYNSSETGARRVDAPLRPLPGDAGTYRVQFTPDAPGQYQFITTLDPDAPINFEVLSPNVEMDDTSLNLELLQTMAEVSQGRLFREENLHELPPLIQRGTDQVTSYRRLELFYSPILLTLLILLAVGEWLIRRLNNLK